jgi:predicted peptidase
MLLGVVFLLSAGSGILWAAYAEALQPRPEPSPQVVQLASLFKVGKYQDSHGYDLPYRYFDPLKESAGKGKFPVVLYLHGEQERGTDNNAQLTTTECATVWVQPRHLKEHPLYVLAPQLRKGEIWTSVPAYASTLALLDQFLHDHPAADRNRIYVVGFSMGATGVYNLLLKNPKLFAAAMPISGSADQYLGETQAWAALKNTPVIILHSYDDAVVPVSAALNAAAALQAGGNRFLGYWAPTPSLWSPGSTASPHDAWFTAFHKFEVIYNSLFFSDLERTHQGEISPTEITTSAI